MKALLVTDIQEGYIEKYDKGLLPRINRRIALAVENQETVIYVKNVRKLRSGARTDEFAQDLHIVSPHIVFKETSSAFSGTGLLDMLREEQVSEIEIVGIDGNSCIARSALDARSHGYKAVLPCACIGVKNTERFEKTKLLLAEKGIAVIE